MGSQLDSDLYVNGTLRAKYFTLPASSVSNASVAGDAEIVASKMQHRHSIDFAQPNTSATSETRVVYVARAAGTILSFKAGSIAAASGAATVTVDLKKNGTSVLSGVIMLDNANTAYTAESGTVTGTSYAAGDVLTVVTVATAGGGTLPTGVYANAVVDEASV